MNVFYGYIALGGAVLIGNCLLFWGFGSASERMNKRIRDGAFSSLMRQEVGWFDLRSPGTITSQLSEDAALLHAFSGEPVRTLILNIASVVVGVIVSFVYMWVRQSSRIAHLPKCILISTISACLAFCTRDSRNYPFLGKLSSNLRLVFSKRLI